MPVIAAVTAQVDVTMKGCPYDGTAAEAVSRVCASQLQIKYLSEI